jgi:hypothetical protein
MVFIETSVFTRQVRLLLDDEEYRALQNTLLLDPEHGVLIQGGGGLRKMRYAVQGRGKSGGVRAIYYWLVEHDQIFMLLMYPKSAKDDLNARETAILKNLVKELRDGQNAV